MQERHPHGLVPLYIVDIAPGDARRIGSGDDANWMSECQ